MPHAQTVLLIDITNVGRGAQSAAIHHPAVNRMPLTKFGNNLFTAPAQAFPMRRSMPRHIRKSQMTDQYSTPRSAQQQGDARDILSRLYREIGISAVAAALEITSPRAESREKADAKYAAQRRRDAA
jgi:hypothetical protein